MSKVFFAYESSSKSGSSTNVDAISKAKTLASNKSDFQIRTWEDLRNNGRILINAIFDAIDDCDIFACDLTYMNHNVFFELGYAIAKGKKLCILLNPDVTDSPAQYSKIDVLKTVAYTGFSNGEDIIRILDNLPEHPKLLEDLSINSDLMPRDIFYIQSSANSQAELETTAWLGKSGYDMIYDDPKEIEYRTFKWYIESIQCASCVIVHLTDISLINADVKNLKASLFAGISCGKEKKTVLLGPKQFNPPIDYTDISIKYSDHNECISKLEKWLNRHLKKRRRTKRKEEQELNLLKLGLGYEIAENEKESLAEYFVETSAYTAAHEATRAFFVGRKGTGKTALHIILSEEFSSKVNANVITLKPESTELLRHVETANLYNSIASKNSLFHSIWKFVLYSKALLSVYNNRLKIQRAQIEIDSTEARIVDFCDEHKYMLNHHFVETLSFLSSNRYEKPLEQFHDDYISPMVRMLQEYLDKHKYREIIILADNLDKTWDVSNDLSVQVDMLLTLFEVTGNIEHELTRNPKNKVKVRVILFLRQDIFNYMLNNAREPDKLILQKHDIDWSNFPDKLNQLIEKRIRFVLELSDTADMDVIWRDYFDLGPDNRNTVFERLRAACLPRPRDMLMFMRQMFESAVNNSHTKVQETDFQFALERYAEFLYQNLIAETSASFPNIRDILSILHENYYDKIELERLVTEIVKMPFDEGKKVDILINSLVINGYFELRNSETGEIYSDYHKARESLVESYRHILFFSLKPKNPTIYAHLTPQYKGRMHRHGKKVEKAEKRSLWNRIVRKEG